jgi:hypothetical protein
MRALATRETCVGVGLRWRSLRQIDEGLRGACVGVVILSPSFMTKKWLVGELDSLVARHRLGDAVLVPVWHDVSAPVQRRSRRVGALCPLMAHRGGRRRAACGSTPLDASRISTVT